jgi:hypothetical protein
MATSLNSPSLSSLANLDAKPEKGTVFNDPAALPDILAGKRKTEKSMDNYRIRYQKLDMDNPSDITELELIETRAIRNQGTFVLSKKEFIFMEKLMILIQYMEETE